MTSAAVEDAAMSPDLAKITDEGDHIKQQIFNVYGILLHCKKAPSGTHS